MKILIIDSLESELLDTLLADNIIYRPDLLRKSTDILGSALIASDVDAIISSAVLPHAAIKVWSEARSATTYWVQIKSGDLHCMSRTDSSDPHIESDNLISLQVKGANQEVTYIEALSQLELQFLRHRSAVASPGIKLGESEGNDKHVLMIGAGLVNLITACTLQKEGYSIHFIDAGPDPREAALWTQYGCSRGGDDARMFTLSEMDNYNDRELSTTMNSLFQRSVVELGWNAHWQGTLSNDEQSWIKEFERIPTWLANRYNEDIFAFNRESQPEWAQWIENDPELFSRSMIREGILRLYSDPAQYAGAVKRQELIRATQRLLTPDQIAVEHPGLAGAVHGGHIAGGIHVVGFTINAHKFIRELLDRLEKGGAKFEWRQRAQNLLFDAQKKMKGVRSESKLLEAVHYVVSPGAYGNTLLEDTRSRGKIHGVLGAWLRLPNVEPRLENSLKLARKGHITEDSNITIATDENGQPILVIGSGYGHTGIDPRNIDESLLHHIYQGLVDTAEKYFPDAYQAGAQNGCIEASFKYCVRPWTASGLGIFEMLQTRSGGKCIITGGHNTGGFAQAPAIAKSVLAALKGKAHPMHLSYDPERTSAFLDMQNGRCFDQRRTEHIN